MEKSHAAKRSAEEAAADIITNAEAERANRERAEYGARDKAEADIKEIRRR